VGVRYRGGEGKKRKGRKRCGCVSFKGSSSAEFKASKRSRKLAVRVNCDDLKEKLPC